MSRPGKTGPRTKQDDELGPPAYSRTAETKLPSYKLRYPDSTYSSALSKYERFWVDRYEFFLDKGFQFRSRYRKGWVPPWGESGRGVLYEEAIRRSFTGVIDGNSSSDGSPVCFKMLYMKNLELDIASYLSSPALRDDSRNHCVEILHTFIDPYDPNIKYLVMPLLRPYNNPDFGVVGEAIDFITQTLEVRSPLDVVRGNNLIQGLSFIHFHNIAHNDCTGGNILMDGRSIAPNGWHPVYPESGPDGFSTLWMRPRIDNPVRYYFTDFGLSFRFKPGEPHVVADYGGADDDVPELLEHRNHDPFKLDVYTLGNIFAKEFYEKYVNLPFLKDLVEYMRVKRITQRPSSQMALEKWLQIKSGVDTSQLSLRQRLRTPTESFPERVVWDAVSIASQGIHGMAKYFV